MSDLLDLLDDLEQPRTHVLMPSMGYACGRTMLESRGDFQVGITDWAAIDCPECRACGRDALGAEMRRQQREQEAVA